MVRRVFVTSHSAQFSFILLSSFPVTGSGPRVLPAVCLDNVAAAELCWNMLEHSRGRLQLSQEQLQHTMILVELNTFQCEIVFYGIPNPTAPLNCELLMISTTSE